MNEFEKERRTNLLISTGGLTFITLFFPLVGGLLAGDILLGCLAGLIPLGFFAIFLIVLVGDV